MAIQSRLKSDRQRRSHTRTGEAERLILRRVARDTRDHVAEEVASKKTVSQDVPHASKEGKRARSHVRRESRGILFMVSSVSARFSGTNIWLPFAADDGSFPLLGGIR